jgi:hypothetical protein
LFYIFKLENKIYVLVKGSETIISKEKIKVLAPVSNTTPMKEGVEIAHDFPVLNATESTFG